MMSKKIFISIVFMFTSLVEIQFSHSQDRGDPAPVPNLAAKFFTIQEYQVNDGLIQFNVFGQESCVSLKSENNLAQCIDKLKNNFINRATKLCLNKKDTNVLNIKTNYALITNKPTYKFNGSSVATAGVNLLCELPPVDCGPNHKHGEVINELGCAGGKKLCMYGKVTWIEQPEIQNCGR